jgi:hypothetical protein
MLIPTHSILCEGVGDKIVVAQTVQDLSYGTWLLGLDSLTLINVGKIDVVVKISSSLVHKNIGCFSGPQDSLEPLQLVQFVNTSATTRKTLKTNMNFDKLYQINNVGHNITFTLDAITQENIPADTKVFLLFSLYKSK